MLIRSTTARIAALCLALQGFAVSAYADFQVHTATVPLQNTNWSRTVTVPRFNPVLGTLGSVSVAMTGHIEGTARYESLDTQPAQIVIDFAANLTVRRPDNNVVLLSSSPLFHRVDTVAAYDGTLDFGGTSGATYNAISSDSTGQFTPPFPLNPADTALFVGAGNVVFTVAANGQTSATGAGNLVSSFSQKASATFTVTYFFTPPFIQDCNGNGIVDSIDLANHTSPDCNLNGIPDECEQLGNDCNHNGIPDECDLAGGVLTDIDQDGLPDQCNCVRVDRRQPASLLLWPEFDNGQGQVSLISVTNVNRMYIEGAVRVEFRYIDGTTCLETNRTEFLSPNDTFAALTRVHQGNTNRGYVYAYAVDNFNRPISHNFLIGDSIRFDGVDAIDYGSSAFTWRAIPAWKQLTDLDNDGIRDLNAFEYEPCPDVILIPRFMGQDATTRGSLIFIGLSGGVQFTTTVDLQIFNDNEDPFSSQYTFRCWAKVPLLSISNMFANSVLQQSQHAPNEVLGDTGTETGWLRIDGRVANSTTTVINDPAVLAVLVENRGAFSTSDLPFELCTQTNGDLLPIGLSGDTSP
ncbi:MAG: choice-of-anchor E domain-containing protein [Planctomycetes bacterium]|nr:choice-of-anchor E domain-containing protein [Planctomycetota bacterium]